MTVANPSAVQSAAGAGALMVFIEERNRISAPFLIRRGRREVGVSTLSSGRRQLLPNGARTWRS